MAVLNGKVTTTMTVLTQLMRLHQITCGHFTADDGSVQLIENNRIKELMNVLEETEGKAIIWANYQRDVTQIIKAISDEYGPGSVVDYYGLTPQEERQENIKRFQNGDECRFIVGTTQTGGYGITLTKANTVIYYSNGYDLEKRLQSEDRAHRIGQTKSVTYVDLIAEDTVDEKIVKALRDKINIASEVLGEELKSLDLKNKSFAFPIIGLYFVLPSFLYACKNCFLGIPSVKLQCIHPLFGSPGV